MTAKRALTCLLVLFGLTASAVGGLHIQYVDGLVARRYYNLAVEHLEKMRKMSTLEAEDKTLIPLRLGSIYASMGERQSDPEKKEALLVLASKNLEEFSTANPSHPKMLDVSLQQVNIQSSRAQAVQVRYENETDARKKAALLKEVEELYKKALAASKVIVEKTTANEKEARQAFARNPKSKKLEAAFWLHYGALVRGMFLAGHLEYLWAQA